MLLMGGISLPSVAAARTVMATQHEPVLVPLIRVVTVAAVLYLYSAALDEETARTDLERRVVQLSLATAAAAAVLIALHAQITPNRHVQVLCADGALAALAAGWFTLATAATIKARTEAWCRGSAPLLAGMGVAELLRIPDQASTALAAAALTATVGAVLAGAGMRYLVLAAHDRHAAAELLSGELDARERRREELNHDARGALGGVRATIVALHRYGDRVDPTTAARLHGAVLGELAHLEQLIVRARANQTTDFAVATVVRDVIETRRAAGLDVRLTIASELVKGTEPKLARGVPADLATAMQNLLVNAEEHAPGARVRVRVRNRYGHAEISVTDDGPGMPQEVAQAAFERGYRGPRSRGSGLGLYSARSVLRENGGDLALRSHSDGATFVVTLPLVTLARQQPFLTGAVS